ncbi:MAG: AEC family transporter [Gammaproteobacteria bacterium]|nr:AEC family transporter [Gammaproteobacteria bacterium]
MLSILAITLPVFLLIGLGYLVVRLEWVARSAVAGMGNYVIYCALPAMLFNALSTRDFSAIIDPSYLAAFAGGSLATLAAGFLLARRLRAEPLESAAFHGLGGAMANSAFIGYAIVVQLFGLAAVVGVALSMLVDLILLVPLTIALAETAGQDRGSVRVAVVSALKKTLSNPLVLAIAAGLLASLLGWRAEGALQKTLELLAGSASAVSLFVIGGMLVGLSLHGRAASIGQMALFKLLLHPAAVASMVWLLPPFAPTLQATAIILAAMPMAGIFPLLAQRYGQQESCAAALVGATLLSFVSINLLLLLLADRGALG